MVDDSRIAYSNAEYWGNMKYIVAIMTLICLSILIPEGEQHEYGQAIYPKLDYSR